MRLTSKQKIRIVFWILPILPFVLCILFIRNTIELINSSDEVSHTGQVVRNLLRLNTELKDLEVEQRQYLLTGDPNALDTFDKDRQKILQEMDSLKKLTANDDR